MRTLNNFALVLINAFTGKQTYYNGQYMYLFTQQSILNNTDKTLITGLLIFLFSIGNIPIFNKYHNLAIIDLVFSTTSKYPVSNS
jgi:hypothetical protein